MTEQLDSMRARLEYMLATAYSGRLHRRASRHVVGRDQRVAQRDRDD
jgi:hypothetical protein